MHKKTLHISLIQSTLHWEDINQNLVDFSEKLNLLGETDLVVLPEMFSTGFSMRPELFAEEAGAKTLSWMQAQAKKHRCAIAGSTMQAESGQYLNRLYFVYPNGEFVYYDKRHLFSLGDEHKHYSRGNKRVFASLLDWRFALQICYDLRFPVYSRNDSNYDVLLYVANWPERRQKAWETLIPARAIENQCYVVACNRIGADGNNITHSGASLVVDYEGSVLLKAQSDSGIFSCTLDYDALSQFKGKFPFLQDQDTFHITL
jgi:predicted amidohydrolase